SRCPAAARAIQQTRIPCAMRILRLSGAGTSRISRPARMRRTGGDRRSEPPQAEYRVGDPAAIHVGARARGAADGYSRRTASAQSHAKLLQLPTDPHNSAWHSHEYEKA